jgi:hypothetical protein
MIRYHLLLILSAISASLAQSCANKADNAEPNSTPRGKERPAAHLPALVAVTVTAAGQVVLLDRTTLTTIRTVEPEKPAAVPDPMRVVEDAARRVFYVGNFNGGLGQIPMDGGKPKNLLGTFPVRRTGWHGSSHQQQCRPTRACGQQGCRGTVACLGRRRERGVIA